MTRTQSAEEPEVLRAVSWNIAAINNNPFEYWITYSDPTYNDLMHSVETFLTDESNDARIMNIFTNQMFCQLKEILEKHKISGLAELEDTWRRDFSRRMAIQEFLKDASIGDKRLTSMPDRVTNTIILCDGSKMLRPTAINAYHDSLRTMEEWWEKWTKFMFDTPVDVYKGVENPSYSPHYVFLLIEPICRSKYPAITTAEQDISVPLQILCLAILDAVFLHILNSVAPGTWETVRRDICRALIDGKESGVCRILRESYLDADVIFLQVRQKRTSAHAALMHLYHRIHATQCTHMRKSSHVECAHMRIDPRILPRQEAAAILIERIAADDALHRRFAVLRPRALDGRRNQNSLILVHRARFRADACADVTRKVLDRLDGSFVAPVRTVARANRRACEPSRVRTVALATA